MANSTKVTNDFIPNSKTKHGYKGHGAKVFFNANEVMICSKTKQGEYWAAQLKNPMFVPVESNDLKIILHIFQILYF